MNRLTHLISDHHPSGLPCRLFEHAAACTGTRLHSLLSTRRTERLAAGTPPTVRAQRHRLENLACLQTDDHTVCRRVRIELTKAHRPGEVFQSGLAIELELRAHLRECDVLDLSPGPRDAAGIGTARLSL